MALLHQQLNVASALTSDHLPASVSGSNTAVEPETWNDLALLVNEQVSVLISQHKRAAEKVYLSILWAGVQPTLDPYTEAFYSRPIALTLGWEEFSVNDVCKCMRDCRVGWAE